MDSINSSGNSDVQVAASIYAQKKSREVHSNEVMSALKTLDESTRQQALQDAATVTGKGANLNIQG